ncbi:Gamma-aminobutyric acid receptor subunit alpha-4 [Porites harrisoni]
MYDIWKSVIILGGLFCAVISSEEPNEYEHSDVVKKLFSSYDRNLRLKFSGGSLNVMVDLYVESFGNIKEADMEYTVFGYFRQSWVDKRLAGKLNQTLVLRNTAIDHAWIPDTYCANTRQSNLKTSASDSESAMRVDINGSVFFTQRIHIIASCEMNLQDFPLDHQECVLKFISYAYNTSDVVYWWAKDNVEIEKKTVAQFQNEKVHLSKTVEQYITGNFSMLSVSFTFHRSIGYYVMQVYAPDVLVVAISWTLFWVDKNDMNTRMAVGVTTILTIVFLLGSANTSLPRVSYAKAIDWYLMVSFAFIFAALVECMFVFHFRIDGGKKENKKNMFSLRSKKKRRFSGRLIALMKTGLRRGSYRIDEEEIIEAPPNFKSQKSSTCDYNGNHIKHGQGKICKQAEEISLSDRIDITSRYLFPIAFLLFNIFYWFAYVYDIRVLPESARDM